MVGTSALSASEAWPKKDSIGKSFPKPCSFCTSPKARVPQLEAKRDRWETREGTCGFKDVTMFQASVRKDTDLLWEVRQNAIQTVRGPQMAGFKQGRAQLEVTGSAPLWPVSVWRLQGNWNSFFTV